MRVESNGQRWSGRREQGMAILEAAVWLVPVATLFLLGFALAGYYHDFNVLKGVSDSMLRESWGKPIRAVFDPSGSSSIVEHEQLRDALVRAVSRATREGQQNLFRVDNFSVRACYWVFEVDTNSGRLGSQLQQVCEESGSAAGRIDFAGPLAQQAGRVVGIGLIGASGGRDGYLSRIVLVGAGVTGDFTGLGTFQQGREITFADVSFPRQELTL